MSKREYRARCHCGRIRFSFRSEEIASGIRCNCSICIRRGGVMSSKYIPEIDFELRQGVGEFTDYRWNDRVVGNIFCKTCGISPFIDCHDVPGYGYRVNLGCVEGLDPLSLPIELLDGKSMEIAPDPGPHPGA